MSRPSRIRNSSLVARLHGTATVGSVSTVECWDAVARGDMSSAASISSTTLDTIQQLNMLDDAIYPTSDFLDRLEREVVGSVSLPSQPITSRPARGSVQTTPARPSWLPTGHRLRTGHWLAAAAIALALLAALVVTRSLVFPRTHEQSAIPAATIPKPSWEPVVQFDFTAPPWGMADPTNWKHMEACFMELDPGKSFSTDVGWYTDIDGPLLITVFSGEVAITPNGPALFYSSDPSQQPQDVQPGETKLLGPNDTIVYSSADGATGENHGSEPMLGLYGLVGIADPTVSGAFTEPTDVTLSSIQGTDNVQPLPGSGASVSIQRLELQPFDSYIFDPKEGSRYFLTFDWLRTAGLHMAAGAKDAWSPNADAEKVQPSTDLTNLPPGPHTLFNLGEKPIYLYLITIEPSPPDASNPSP
jgi:hypothetical protein